MGGIQEFSLSCPIPISDYPTVLLAHGGGGKLMHQLIERMFVPTFRNPLLDVRHDGAVVSLDGVKLAFTTDSYVVRPLCFPGGGGFSPAASTRVWLRSGAGSPPKMSAARRYLSVSIRTSTGRSVHCAR